MAGSGVESVALVLMGLADDPAESIESPVAGVKAEHVLLGSDDSFAEPPVLDDVCPPPAIVERDWKSLAVDREVSSSSDGTTLQ